VFKFLVQETADFCSWGTWSIEQHPAIEVHLWLTLQPRKWSHLEAPEAIGRLIPYRSSLLEDYSLPCNSSLFSNFSRAQGLDRKPSIDLLLQG